MSLFEAGAFAALIILLGVFVRWYDPQVVQQLARQLGVGARLGWLTYLIGTALVVFPLVMGAQLTVGSGSSRLDTSLWMVGSVLSVAGLFFLVLAITSIDEYRAFRRATKVTETDPLPSRTGEQELVALTGMPTPQADAESPLSGVPAVVTDWMVQERDRAGGIALRETWHNRATGVQTVPFTVGREEITVYPGDHRAMGAETIVQAYDSEESLPDPAQDLFRTVEDLPRPTERDSPVQFVEDFVPAELPVTVVGYPELGDDGVVIRDGPEDPYLGTDRSPAGDATEGESDGPEPILLPGDIDRARSLLRRRTIWFGVGGAITLVVGQAIAFALSAASVPGL